MYQCHYISDTVLELHVPLDRQLQTVQTYKNAKNRSTKPREKLLLNS